VTFVDVCSFKNVFSDGALAFEDYDRRGCYWLEGRDGEFPFRGLEDPL